MKKANGIVLDNPSKPDYRTPASFRIIVLLETISKILKRLSALCLTSAARCLGLLHPNQCGSQAGLGCFDAVATLTDQVRLLQPASFKVSTLFLDVKGGIDNVCANKLTNILSKGGVSAYLVAWIKSFLSKRQCRLILQGAPKVFCPVAVGTPQRSPICPVLWCFIWPASTRPSPKVWPFHLSTTIPSRSARTLDIRGSRIYNFILASSKGRVPISRWLFLSPKLNSFTGGLQRTARIFPLPLL